MSNSSEISANGRNFRLSWSGSSGPLWVVFPGLRYRLHFDALARVQQDAIAAGAQICGVHTDYDEDPRLAGLAQGDAVAMIREDARAIYDQLPPADVSVGKSVGCVSLLEADLPQMRYVWMTPNLTAEVMMTTVQSRSARSFIVAGQDDPVTPPDLLVATGAPSVALPGLGHSLTTEDPAKDAPILDRMDAALRDWI